MVIQTTFRELRNDRFSPNLATKRSSVSRPVDESGKTFSKLFTLGIILLPRFEIESRSNRHITQSRLRRTAHGMHCTEILFSPRCSPRACREFPRSVNISTPKTYLPVTSLQPRGYTSQNDYGFSMWYSTVKRGAFWHRSFPATSDRGAGDPNPKLAQIFAYGKRLYPYRMLRTRRVRSGPKMSKNSQF